MFCYPRDLSTQIARNARHLKHQERNRVESRPWDKGDNLLVSKGRQCILIKKNSDVLHPESAFKHQGATFDMCLF